MDSEYFSVTQMHEMRMVDGLHSMRELAELVIPAGGVANFEPGGKHLMLEQPVRPIADEQSPGFELTFASGKTQAI